MVQSVDGSTIPFTVTVIQEKQSGGDDPSLTISPMSVSFASTPQLTKTLQVSSNVAWTAASSKTDVCTISPDSGSGDATVTLTSSGNTSTSANISLNVVFSSDDISTPVTVSVIVRKAGEPSGDIDEYLDEFRSYVDVEEGSVTYDYLEVLYEEAKSQFEDETSVYGIPAVHKQALFPVMYSFGSISAREAAFKTMVGWLFALQLSELKPVERTAILKVGYEMGGYDRYDNIYGYEFKSDPNYARITAGAIYAAMRGTMNPAISTMRSEVGGSKYSQTLAQLDATDTDHVSKNDFFIDLRQFLPTCPGPFDPAYPTPTETTYPDEAKDSYKNLQVDRDVHEDIITKYNLDNNTYKQMTVQAIADKEADPGHLFGPNRTTTNYSFHPVFGTDTIGTELETSGNLADFVSLAISCSSHARKIMQSTSVSPIYRRMRPGCSWTQTGVKNSTSDNRRNILTKFEIEQYDGHPDGYYDQNGNWITPENITDPDAYEEYQRNALYSNSYPSGHSSGITGGAMVLMELMPDKTDLILKAMNQFAVNRTIARYHWTSDTINGRVLGTAQNAVAHAASDYDTLLAAAGGGGGGGGDINVTLSYSMGGYGSCHVDSGETSMYHYCTKEATVERHPGIKVSQTVNFTIDGAGVTVKDTGATSGTWQANTTYYLTCPAVGPGEEKIAKITMSNSNGKRVLYYRLSESGTHDDGTTGWDTDPEWMSDDPGDTSSAPWNTSSSHSNNDPFGPSGNGTKKIGTITNVPSSYGVPSLYGIYICIDYTDIDGDWRQTSGSMINLDGVTFSSTGSNSYDINAVILDNANATPKKIHLYVTFSGTNEIRYINVYQKSKS